MDETGLDNIDESAYISDRNEGEEDDDDVVQSATPQHLYYIWCEPERYWVMAGM